MGIKCSLLGHRFTATDVEEEREEEGSEVVITRKEIETCARCGESRVVSENKEVTSLAAESAEGDGDTETATAETGTTAGSAAAPDMDAAEEDAELLDAGGDETSDPDAAAAPTPDEGEPEPAADEDSDVAAPDDDAVILDDGDDEPARDPGEWPEESEADEDESGPEPADQEQETADSAGTRAVDETVTEDEWPDEYGYDEGSDATAEEVSWPEEDEGDDDEWKPSESLTESIDGADIESGGSAAVTVPDGEFVCTECSFTTLVEESSLRAGDFCPECRRGTLEHQPETETRKE